MKSYSVTTTAVAAKRKKRVITTFSIHSVAPTDEHKRHTLAKKCRKKRLIYAST